MPSLRIRVEDVYDSAPSIEHASGDVWRSLPTFGLLPHRLLPGIVVTPACDLSNQKTETITYLPIMGIRSIMSGPPFRRFAIQRLREALVAAGVTDEADAVAQRASPFGLSDLSALKSRVGDLQLREPMASRIATAVDYLSIVLSNGQSAYRPDYLGKDHSRILDSLIRNSHRSDLHFLPPDGLSNARSVIADPSCVLLRYPITIPIDLLDTANDLSIANWAAATAQLSSSYPSAGEFTDQPLKMLRLKGEFLSDLISRYLALFMRLGSGDFTARQVTEFMEAV